jgi:hypothetical protein
LPPLRTTTQSEHTQDAAQQAKQEEKKKKKKKKKKNLSSLTLNWPTVALAAVSIISWLLAGSSTTRTLSLDTGGRILTLPPAHHLFTHTKLDGGSFNVKFDFDLVCFFVGTI